MLRSQQLGSKIKKPRQRRYGRRPPITLAGPPIEATPDRRATEIPLNAKVAPIEIDDPYAASVGTTKIIALRSIRSDPLGNMHARHQIDDAQFAAGRYWQWLYERSSVGSVQAVDTSKEPVDGGGFPEILTDGQRLAMRKLRHAAVALGLHDAWLIERVLGDGLSVADAAGMRGDISDSSIAAWRFNFGRALDTLAVEFDFANRLGRRVAGKSAIGGPQVPH